MFSENEKKVLKIIGRRKRTIKEITKIFYKGEKFPIGANNNVGATIRRIIKKCEWNELPWTIEGYGSGRRGRTVWKEEL